MRESLYYCYFYTNVFPLNFAHTLRNTVFAALKLHVAQTLLHSAFTAFTLLIALHLAEKFSAAFKLHVAITLRNLVFSPFTLLWHPGSEILFLLFLHWVKQYIAVSVFSCLYIAFNLVHSKSNSFHLSIYLKASNYLASFYVIRSFCFPVRFSKFAIWCFVGVLSQKQVFSCSMPFIPIISGNRRYMS